MGAFVLLGVLAPRIAFAEVTVYLDGTGGRVFSGRENGAQGRSSVLNARGLSAVEVPPYRGDAASWDRLVRCVQDQFNELDVTIVETRPARGRYVRAMLGGRPDLLELPKFVGGIAPYSARVIDDAVLFVFTAAIPGARQRCEATAHEIGHVLGLDHSTACEDTMSYGRCGPKQFRSTDAPCGEFGARACGDGRSTQNSRDRLLALVGPSVPPHPRTAAPASSPPSRVGPRTGSDPRGPQIRVLTSPGTTRGNATLLVRFAASDRDGIADVALAWSDGRNTVRIACRRSVRIGASAIARCSRRNNVYTFALPVGSGSRSFVVEALDGAGHRSSSKPRHIELR